MQPKTTVVSKGDQKGCTIQAAEPERGFQSALKQLLRVSEKSTIENGIRFQLKTQQEKLTGAEHAVPPNLGDCGAMLHNFPLPSHFFMLIAGKPGSGKTALIEQFVNMHHLYGGNKFDRVLLISQSWEKIFMPRVSYEDKHPTMSLPWLEDKISEINAQQITKIEN